MSDPDLAQIRDELQDAREGSKSELNEPLGNVIEAVGRLDERDEDPKPDRLESIHEELTRLLDDTDGEVRERIRRARDHVRAYHDNLDELAED